MSWRHLQLLLFLFFITGCSERNDQFTQEFNGAVFFTKTLAFYDVKFPGTAITNIEQVFIATETPYPVRWHQEFRTFGKHAGFKNSIYEKYVTVAPPIRHSDVPGEIVVLNALPFPNRTGEVGRVLISRTGNGVEDWAITWLPEGRVQLIFRETGRTIPPFYSKPKPPDFTEPSSAPLSHRIDRLFVNVAREIGLGSAAGSVLMRVAFALIGVFTILLVWLGWTKAR